MNYLAWVGISLSLWNARIHESGRICVSIMWYGWVFFFPSVDYVSQVLLVLPSVIPFLQFWEIHWNMKLWKTTLACASVCVFWDSFTLRLISTQAFEVFTRKMLFALLSLSHVESSVFSGMKQNVASLQRTWLWYNTLLNRKQNRGSWWLEGFKKHRGCVCVCILRGFFPPLPFMTLPLVI